MTGADTKRIVELAKKYAADEENQGKNPSGKLR